MNDSFLMYRASSTISATHLDLILATYDGLARDLSLVGRATAAADIEGRCRASNHALWLLGYLESWVELLGEKELEDSLRVFYSFLRTELIRLQGRPVADAADRLVELVCETRAAWQQKLRPVPAPAEDLTSATPAAMVEHLDAGAGLRWSA